MEPILGRVVWCTITFLASRKSQSGMYSPQFTRKVEKKLKFGRQVEVSSNIAQNHSPSLQEVTSGHYLSQSTYKVDQN